MAKRMLIEATHPEETRVVVVDGTHLEAFDVETSTKKQCKGNVYLAQVIRIEPSLQAAFVDYGSERHGFLSLSEIHPDYYHLSEVERPVSHGKQSQAALMIQEDLVVLPQPEDMCPRRDADVLDEAQSCKSLRVYKIQEVIRRRQIMLVQIVKEERGNKGAALTTYLSLAGRYCVLMPNNPKGSGISRKITSLSDRKRLKTLLTELNIPNSMAVILRTAGAERSKSDIRRDYEYLARTWNQIREVTQQSQSPSLVYEEANLIKRALRDLYARDVDEIIVAGDEGYRRAKDFMKILTPSHAKKVQRYKEKAMPLFGYYEVAAQLDAMHSAAVQLPSGGHVVFSQTEALVAIDVNSGKATRERHIEETALKTNLEAAEEIARQLRLRDLAGLIVIDFIDMEEIQNNLTVENRLKEAMRSDRARIQIGRISPFGLMELSRQRLRPSLMETDFQSCPHCNGTGLLRSLESSAMHVLRGIEEEGFRHRSLELSVTCPSAVALYILNHKRLALAQLENRYGLHVLVFSDGSLVPPAYRMERLKSGCEEVDMVPDSLLEKDEMSNDDDMDDIAFDEEASGGYSQLEWQQCTLHPSRRGLHSTAEVSRFKGNENEGDAEKENPALLTEKKRVYPSHNSDSEENEEDSESHQRRKLRRSQRQVSNEEIPHIIATEESALAVPTESDGTDALIQEEERSSRTLQKQNDTALDMLAVSQDTDYDCNPFDKVRAGIARFPRHYSLLKQAMMPLHNHQKDVSAVSAVDDVDQAERPVTVNKSESVTTSVMPHGKEHYTEKTRSERAHQISIRRTGWWVRE